MTGIVPVAQPANKTKCKYRRLEVNFDMFFSSGGLFAQLSRG